MGRYIQHEGTSYEIHNCIKCGVAYIIPEVMINHQRQAECDYRENVAKGAA